MKVLRLRAWLSCALLLCGLAGIAGASSIDRPVVVIPITGTVDDGMAHLVERSVDEANRSNARAILLTVNSPGGLVSSAFRIRDALFSAQEPVDAYVSQRAYSAAALITLSANRIIMAPGASIGAAEPVEAGGTVPPSDKIISALRGEFESTAERTHHSPQIAGAMVDKNASLPQYKRSGMVLTLNTDDAVRAGVAEGTATTLDAALADLKLAGAPLVTQSYSFGEIARALRDRSGRQRPLVDAGNARPFDRDANLARHRRHHRRRRPRALFRKPRLCRLLQRLRRRAGSDRTDRNSLGAARRSRPRTPRNLGGRCALGGRLAGLRLAISLRRRRNDRDGDRAYGYWVHVDGTGRPSERVGASSGALCGARAGVRHEHAISARYAGERERRQAFFGPPASLRSTDGESTS